VTNKETAMAATPPPAPDSSHAADAADFTTALLGLRRTLYQRALFLTQDRAAADDLAQATVERALLSRARFRLGTNLRGWLLLMMRNLFIDDKRRAVFHGGSIDDDCPCPAPDWAPGPIELLSDQDVKEASDRLGKDQREIFTLAYVDRLSYREIGQRLGITQNATGGRLLRARSRMRALLEDTFERRRDELVKGRRSDGRRHAVAG
jgi:RNA polymerase sigma-70 factor, ECF subfamily